MALGYISLAYLIDFRMIKLYLLPMYMLEKYGRGSISLQSPSNLSGMSVQALYAGFQKGGLHFYWAV